MTGEIVKIKDLPFVPNPTQVQKDADFSCASTIITNTVKSSIARFGGVFSLAVDLPDLQDLLNLLRPEANAPEEQNRRHILLHHLALLSNTERFLFLSQAHVRVKGMELSEYCNVTSRMGTKNWKRSYIPLPMRQVENFRSYLRRNEAYDEGWELIRLLRNFSVHYMDIDFQYKEMWVDAMTMRKFVKELINLQLALAEEAAIPLTYSILWNPWLVLTFVLGS